LFARNLAAAERDHRREELILLAVMRESPTASTVGTVTPIKCVASRRRQCLENFAIQHPASCDAVEMSMSGASAVTRTFSSMLPTSRMTSSEELLRSL
jgi:hypothetical protein